MKAPFVPIASFALCVYTPLVASYALPQQVDPLQPAPQPPTDQQTTAPPNPDPNATPAGFQLIANPYGLKSTKYARTKTQTKIENVAACYEICKDHPMFTLNTAKQWCTCYQIDANQQISFDALNGNLIFENQAISEGSVIPGYRTVQEADFKDVRGVFTEIFDATQGGELACRTKCERFAGFSLHGTSCQCIDLSLSHNSISGFPGGKYFVKDGAPIYRMTTLEGELNSFDVTLSEEEKCDNLDSFAPKCLAEHNYGFASNEAGRCFCLINGKTHGSDIDQKTLKYFVHRDLGPLRIEVNYLNYIDASFDNIKHHRGKVVKSDQMNAAYGVSHCLALCRDTVNICVIDEVEKVCEQIELGPNYDILANQIPQDTATTKKFFTPKYEHLTTYGPEAFDRLRSNFVLHSESGKVDSFEDCAYHSFFIYKTAQAVGFDKESKLCYVFKDEITNPYLFGAWDYFPKTIGFFTYNNPTLVKDAVSLDGNSYEGCRYANHDSKLTGALKETIKNVAAEFICHFKAQGFSFWYNEKTKECHVYSDGPDLLNLDPNTVFHQCDPPNSDASTFRALYRPVTPEKEAELRQSNPSFAELHYALTTTEKQCHDVCTGSVLFYVTTRMKLNNFFDGDGCRCLFPAEKGAEGSRTYNDYFPKDDWTRSAFFAEEVWGKHQHYPNRLQTRSFMEVPVSHLSGKKITPRPVAEAKEKRVCAEACDKDSAFIFSATSECTCYSLDPNAQPFAAPQQPEAGTECYVRDDFYLLALM